MRSAMTRSSLLVAVALSGLVACDKPTPASYPVAEGRRAAAPDSVSVDTSLAALPGDQVASITGPAGATLRLAYDGAHLVGEVQGAPAPSDGCPLIVYVGVTGGEQRQEFHFNPQDVSVLVQGSALGGKAPRTRVTAGGAYRFYLPMLDGDVAVQAVAGCPSVAVAPTLVAELTRYGGLTWATASGPTVVGVRAAAGAAAGRGADTSRFMPGDEVELVGSGLDAVTAVRFGDAVVTPSRTEPGRLVLTTPADGDTDVAIPVVGPDDLGAVWLPVEGTVHRIGDAMDHLAESVWGTWLVILLVGAGFILTLVNGFPQLRGFRHALSVIRGHYDNPDEEGEINHFQALTAALSATVGLGNIAGVAVAVTNGGPGAIFWMWICGFLGMATKYSECTLATATREVREDGSVAGGPMYYMAKHLPPLLRPLAVAYAVFITFASFGGGNMFQANQAAALWSASFGVPTWVVGLVLVGLVGLVIVGGIKRIGNVTDKLVPTMVAIYVIGALAVIGVNIERFPEVFGAIFTEAFSVSAAVGGVLGVVIKDVLIQGFRRAAFSNEAGFGSAAIAHAAVKTDEPVREGVVALLEPFIDTVVICTMTGLVILLSGAWTQQGLEGAPLTAAAFDSAFHGFGSILIPIAVFMFAISTMISWSYYGEKGVEFLFGRRAILPYRLLFVALVFIGSVWKLGPVLDFSDAMLGLVAVPNLIAILLLTPRLRRLTRDYFSRLRSGQLRRYQ